MELCKVIDVILSKRSFNEIWKNHIGRFTRIYEFESCVPTGHTEFCLYFCSTTVVSWLILVKHFLQISYKRILRFTSYHLYELVLPNFSFDRCGLTLSCYWLLMHRVVFKLWHLQIAPLWFCHKKHMNRVPFSQWLDRGIKENHAWL